MGAQLAKGGVAVDGKAAGDSAAAKTNGQENGHVKTNGDVSAKPDGETVAADGNGTAEVAKDTEAATGDAIEPAPAPAEGEAEAKAEGDAAKEGKKKKKFSLKNSFKFKGISLKKGGKKGSEEATSPTAEEAKPEENGHAAEPSADAEAAPADAAAADAPAAETTEAAPEAEAAEAKPEEAAPSEEAPASEEPAAAAPAAEETTPATDASEPEQKAE